MNKNNSVSEKINRRTFLQKSALFASGIAAANLLKVSAFAANFPIESPIAATKYGKIRGYTDDGINVFKGVRYGADTKQRRFMPPLPPENWADIRDTVEYGAASPQQGRGSEKMSEDCLFLNIFTPGLRDGRKRPVMFYIHGGAYSAVRVRVPLYDGVRLCKRGDVVVVSINHRLNAFGYLYLARFGVTEFADSGNVGQLDLILALNWVRENIAEFGGDPNNVMVFGQSGGGAKIATMMAMPAAKGLFHRAATMSGQQVTGCGIINGTLRAKAILDALKISPERINEIRTIPMERIIESLSTKDPVLSFGSVNFAPVLDERSLPRHPFYPMPPHNQQIFQ